MVNDSTIVENRTRMTTFIRKEAQKIIDELIVKVSYIADVYCSLIMKKKKNMR